MSGATSRAMSGPFPSGRFDRLLNTVGAWTLGILWFLPLIYAVWTAFHPAAYAVRFDIFAPSTMRKRVWNQ